MPDTSVILSAGCSSPSRARERLYAACSRWSSRCAALRQLAVTQRLQNLSESGFDGAAPEWPQVVNGHTATARATSTADRARARLDGYLYDAISVRGRPPAAALAAATQRLASCSDGRARWRATPVSNMRSSADETFGTQMRGRDRISAHEECRARPLPHQYVG